MGIWRTDAFPWVAASAALSVQRTLQCHEGDHGLILVNGRSHRGDKG